MSEQSQVKSPEKKRLTSTSQRLSSTISSQSGKLSSPILQLQCLLGNRRVAQLIQARRLTPQGRIIGLRRKPIIRAADDQYAPETDRVARQVMTIPDTGSNSQTVKHTGGAPLQPKRLAEITPIKINLTTQKADSVFSDNNEEQRSLGFDTSAKQLFVQRQGGIGVGTSGCGIPADCPSSFCTPFPGGKQVAAGARDVAAPILLTGIAAKVNPQVVPLWAQYLFGGTAPQDLTSKFAGDFTSSATTAKSTNFLVGELKKELISNPPPIPVAVPVVTIDIPTRIPNAISAIGNPTDPHKMDFDVIGEIPGNIAGGIGKDQSTCQVGARPSPFDDNRTASGTALVTKNADGSMTVVPTIIFTVRDTIDLCPGNCGANIEQNATLPMSRFEAAGVSGDVPFTVTFLAPPTVFAINPSPTPVPTPPFASRFRSRRFAGQLTLEACVEGKHRMLQGETDSDATSKLQETLADAGIPIKVDGIFGRETERAIAKFKRGRIPPIVPSDGVVGVKTSQALDEVAVAKGK